MADALPRRAELVALGRALQAARAATGWTVTELAESTAVSRRYISKIENGHANPSVQTLLTLAEVLGVRASTLLRQAEADTED